MPQVKNVSRRVLSGDLSEVYGHTCGLIFMLLLSFLSFSLFSYFRLISLRPDLMHFFV